jgi:DNA-binding CsgD family transcriptional regulator
MAFGLEMTAWVEADRGHVDRAARLLGTVEAENPLGLTMLRVYRDRFANRARASLGAEVFDEQRRRGRTVTVEEAVALVLGSDHRALMPSGSGSTTSVLSGRELEIAALIAAGLPNPRIATQLVISRRTVEGHVQRILAKLDYSSRTQIAAWYVTYIDPERSVTRG